MSQSWNEIEFRRELLIAFQTALLGVVTLNLRGVNVEWTKHLITGLFIYDGEVSQYEQEIVSDVEGEVISHFLDHTIELTAIETSAQEKLDQYSRGAWVYRRME